jgi:hypothetical protein
VGTLTGMVEVGTVGRGARLAGGVIAWGDWLTAIGWMVVGVTVVDGAGTSVVVGKAGSVVVVGAAGTVVVDPPPLASAPTVDPTSDGSVDPRPAPLPEPGLDPGAAWAVIPTRLPGAPNRATTKTTVTAVIVAMKTPVLDRQNSVPAWYLPLMCLIALNLESQA